VSRLEVPVRRVAHGAGLPLPTYATEGSAGLDLMAAITAPVDLPPMGRAVVPTGIAIALPSGYEAQVRSRSGLAAKHGITVLNAPGTIDTDYRGEIGVTLVNLGDAPFRVEPGMRVAQMVVAPVSTVAWNELEELPASRRGGGGFGSTGNGNAPG
jgi:dUTP pyrophosphatase